MTNAMIVSALPRGVTFTQCHSRAMCAPTRQVFTMGKYLCRGHVNDVRPTVAQVLQRAGCRTCIAGKWMLGRMDPRERGFDEGAVQVNGFRFWSPHVVVYGSAGYLQEHNLAQRQVRKKDYDWPIDGSQPGAVQLRGQYGPDVSCRFAHEARHMRREDPVFLYD